MILCALSCFSAIVYLKICHHGNIGVKYNKKHCPYDPASQLIVMESHLLPPPLLSGSPPLKGKSNRPTKWFSLTPQGDKVHFQATLRGLSLKHPAIHNCGFDKLAFFSTSKVKVFSNGRNITTVEANKPHGTTKWALCNSGEGNKCHKNVISPLMLRALLAPTLDTYWHVICSGAIP